MTYKRLFVDSLVCGSIISRFEEDGGVSSRYGLIQIVDNKYALLGNDYRVLPGIFEEPTIEAIYAAYGTNFGVRSSDASVLNPDIKAGSRFIHKHTKNNSDIYRAIISQGYWTVLNETTNVCGERDINLVSVIKAMLPRVDDLVFI